MIKIKDILVKNKIAAINESFKAGKLRALVGNRWSGLDSTFWSYGAKLGIEWNKITDKEIETNAKPKKKGIEIAYIDKDVTVPMKGKQSDYYRGSNIGIDKFTAISVLKDGKPLWYTKSWKPLTNVHTATGKKAKNRYSGNRSTIPDVDAGTRTYSRDKQFGMNEIGYMSLSGMMKIPGIKFHQIKLDEDQPYMGAGVKRQMRQAAQFGAAKFTTNDEFKRINDQYFNDLLKAKLNDPKQLKKKVKQAADLCQSIIDSALGGKKATGKVKKFIDSYQSNRSAKTGESEAYQLTAEVGRQLSRLYEYYGYYLGAIQKQKEDKIKYGTVDFAAADVEGYAKDIQNKYNTIIQMKFR
tara:strand:+ start:57 stop:1118 length:1062 start_codon:yes stop_codon:yes gene_type:complete